MYSFFENARSKYAAAGALRGHHGAIVCLRVTEDGKFLASGGTDGTRVWNLETMKPIQRPSGSGNRGSTTCMTWARREDESAEILFFGTQNGQLIGWKQAGAAGFEELHSVQLVNAGEVTGLAFDSASNRLIVCHRNSVVQSYAIDRSITPQPIFSVVIENFVPKAIAFGDFKNNEQEIMVFGLHDGRIHTLRGSTGETVRTRQVGGMIGDANVHSRKGFFCLDDPFQGVALYRLDDEHRVKTFEIKTTKSYTRPRQVCFADDGSCVVSGSDHGTVYIFDRWTGETVDELKVGALDWAQTVTAAEVNGITTIIAARSRELSGPNNIMLWKKTGGQKRQILPSCGQCMIILNLLLALGCLVFLYKNVLGSA
ncbi:WD40-repeat-containing domain protein [Mycena galericulata]|nr:WD40-repeat-containing domain protein [Mycena galericulata]